MMNDKTADGLKGSAYTVGGNTQVSGVTLRGSYGSGSSDGYRGSGYAFGADYSINDALAIGYTYAKSSWTEGSFATTSPGTQNTIGLKYSLSKRTFTYVTFSSFGDASTLANNQGAGGGTEAVKSVTSIGVAHAF